MSYELRWIPWFPFLSGLRNIDFLVLKESSNLKFKLTLSF